MAINSARHKLAPAKRPQICTPRPSPADGSKSCHVTLQGPTLRPNLEWDSQRRGVEHYPSTDRDR
eukprot:3786325-Amphidinium_carterae.1